MTKKFTISLLCATLALPAGPVHVAAAARPEARKAESRKPEARNSADAAQAADAAFLLARDASRSGDAARLNRAAVSIGDHVLAPYVEYWQLRLRLEDKPAEEVLRFLDRHSGTLLAEYLRREWLKVLGRKSDWERFREQQPLLVTEDADVNCYSLAARWQLKDVTALEELRSVWRSPKALPEGCTPLVQALLASPAPGSADEASPQTPHWDSAQLWERFRILSEANQGAAARRLLAALPRGEAPDAKLLDSAWNAAVKYLERPVPDLSRRSQREVYILALTRVARSDPALAASYWEGKVSERFSAEDQVYVLGLIATSAARRHMPEAMRWFSEIAAMGGDAQLSDEQLAWRVRIALRQGNWDEVRRAIGAMSSSGRSDSAWIYWLGRAYKARGNEAGAKAQFARISTEHSFYGRLAAEELGLPPLLPDNAPGPTAREMAEAHANPGLQRALALYRLEMRTEGLREWLWAIRGMDDRSLLAAAELARSREIWDRAINTADRTLKEHNFSVRYLAPFRDVLADAAKERSLDESLVLGLVRQESRFMHFARSSAGAAGLMQLMPATAAWVARKMGMSNYAWSRVKEPDVNARLGAFYLRQVLDDLGGSPVVAAAAYNAGPGRARRWRDSKPLEGAIYAESIPFNETRDYAKKVMSNSIYYAALLGEVRSLKARLGMVGTADEPGAAQRSDPTP